MNLRTRSTISAALVASVLLVGCFGQSDSDRVDIITSDLILLVEGKGSNQLVRHCPDDLSDLTISMESGGYVVEPESLDELEEALDEFRSPFNGEAIETTQERVDIDEGQARVSITFRVSDEGWERTLPVRLDLDKMGNRWVLTGLSSFD